MGGVNAGIPRRKTMSSIDGCANLAGGQVLADQTGCLRPALPGHFRHVAPQQSFRFPPLFCVVVLTQRLPNPFVNLLPAVSGKLYLLACFQQGPDLFQAQLLPTLHADDQSPACATSPPSGSSCARIARSFRLILYEIR